MVRRIPIRAKVAGALALPLGVLAVGAGVGVSTSAADSRDLTRQTEMATASIGHTGLLGSLQDERNLALIEMLDLGEAIDLEVGDQETARRHTDVAAAALRRGVAGQTDVLREDYALALTVLDDLAGLRTQVDAAREAPSMDNRERAHDIFASYTSMIATFFAAHDRFALLVDDPRLRQGDDMLHYASHASDATAQLVEALLYHGAGAGGVDGAAEVADIARLQRDVMRSVNTLRIKGTGDYREATDELLANPRVAGLAVLVDDIVERERTVDPAALLTTTPLGPGSGYPDFRDRVVDAVDARVSELQGAARNSRRLYLGGALALVAAALLIAWLVSRSITRPLRSLAVKARQMATERLPAAVEEILVTPPGEDLRLPADDPIVVPASDEVAEVAGAFNDVQRAAIDLAVEQAALRRNVAESYVNLGRRNQNLLGRLLNGLGELERSETDPHQLNQIRRLDHLATRIRRNADSLLVLSEAEPPSGMHSPAEIGDVVRSALGEIENHDRVLVRSLDPALVLGSASADLAHLLAELIENGLRHSPPRELVEVSGRAGSGGYAISIIDHGLGMSPEDLERANQRLAGQESFAVTPGKYLGHYVTAVLAARHGIRVQLQGSVVVGIAALVELPGPLLAAGPQAPSRPAPPVTPGEPVPGGPAPGPTFGADQGVTPSPEDVRQAVALLRSGGAPLRPALPAPPAPPAAVPPPPAAGTPGAAPASLWAQPASPVPAPDTGARTRPAGPGTGPMVVVPDEVTNGSAPAARAPERTASGLVRRVRGSHVNVGPALAGGGAGASRQPPPPAIDAPEFRRFLTNLVGGVQRSLADQVAPGPTEPREGNPGDEAEGER